MPLPIAYATGDTVISGYHGLNGAGVLRFQKDRSWYRDITKLEHLCCFHGIAIPRIRAASTEPEF